MPPTHFAEASEARDRTRGGEPLDLSLLVLFSTLIYGWFHFGGLYGEQDTARLVIDALTWLKTNVRDYFISEYRYYASAGYIWLIKVLYPWAERSGLPIAFWLNTINWVCVLLFPVPTYFLFRGLLGRWPAVLGVALLMVTPAFWISGLYGFPSLPALLFIVAALLLWDRRLTGSLRGPTWAQDLAVVLLLSGATLLKADLWMSCVALLGLAVFRKQTTPFRLAEVSLIAAVPALVSLLLSLVLMRDSPTPAAYLAAWHAQYLPELDLEHLREASVAMRRSLGVASFFVLGIGVIRLLQRRQFRLLFLVSTWAIVPVAFWAFRSGDSARHHLPATVPAALALAWLFAEFHTRRWVPVFLLGGVIAGNYLARPASPSTLSPSGRLFKSAELIRERVGRYHQAAQEYAGFRLPRKIILGSFTNPYFDAEVLTSAKSVVSIQRGRQSGYDVIEIVHAEGEDRFVSASARISPTELMDAIAFFSESGYQVFVFEYAVQGTTVQARPPIQKLSIYPPTKRPRELLRPPATDRQAPLIH